MVHRLTPSEEATDSARETAAMITSTVPAITFSRFWQGDFSALQLERSMNHVEYVSSIVFNSKPAAV